MSYEELRQAHAENMARVRAALDGNDPNTAIIATLRADLAAATARAEAVEAAHNRVTAAYDEAMDKLEAAEAALAAAPVDEIRQLYISAFTPTDPEKYDNYRRVAKWLWPDSEVQP